MLSFTDKSSKFRLPVEIMLSCCFRQKKHKRVNSISCKITILEQLKFGYKFEKRSNLAIYRKKKCLGFRPFMLETIIHNHKGMGHIYRNISENI